jgi:hypothetical protein
MRSGPPLELRSQHWSNPSPPSRLAVPASAPRTPPQSDAVWQNFVFAGLQFAAPYEPVHVDSQRDDAPVSEQPVAELGSAMLEMLAQQSDADAAHCEGAVQSTADVPGHEV